MYNVISAAYRFLQKSLCKMYVLCRVDYKFYVRVCVCVCLRVWCIDACICIVAIFLRRLCICVHKILVRQFYVLVKGTFSSCSTNLYKHSDIHSARAFNTHKLFRIIFFFFRYAPCERYIFRRHMNRIYTCPGAVAPSTNFGCYPSRTLALSVRSVSICLTYYCPFSP